MRWLSLAVPPSLEGVRCSSQRTGGGDPSLLEQSLQNSEVALDVRLALLETLDDSCEDLQDFGELLVAVVVEQGPDVVFPQ